MFWLRNKKIIFSYTLLSGGLGDYQCRVRFLPYHAGYNLYTTFSPNFFPNLTCLIPFISMLLHVENSVDPDQLASEKPADLDLHCFQNRIYPGLTWYGFDSTCYPCCNIRGKCEKMKFYTLYK